MCPSLPKLLPIPNLTLRLSSNSILDTILINNGAPVFNIETTANRTIVYRCNPWSGQSPVASIEWSAPGNFPSLSGPVITIDSVVYNLNTFFKKSVLGGSRKFYIPGQQNPLRWKRSNSTGRYECYICSHACTVHTAVATFEPANLTAPARLCIYTDTVSPHDQYPSNYENVSTSLIHYLIVTSILIHNQDWKHQHCSVERRDTWATSSSPVSLRPKLDLLSADDDFSSPDSPASCLSSLPSSPISAKTEISYQEYYSDLSRHLSTKKKKSYSPYQITPFITPKLPSHPRSTIPESSLLLSHPVPYQSTISIPEELPPAYNQIEWTVRVPQTRRY